MEGEKVIIIFEDGISASKRQGIVTKITDFSVYLDNKDIIPRHRIIRIEIID